MTKSITFEAKSRDTSGTGAARAIRNSGLIPVIVYGKNFEPLKLVVDNKHFTNEYERGNIGANVVTLNVDEGKHNIKALVRDIQLHKVTDKVLHVDMQALTPGNDVRVSVRVHIVGEDRCPGLKKGGVMNIVHRRILFYCEPDSIPDYIEVDVGGMDIGSAMHIQDISLPSGISPIEKSNFSLVSISGRAED